MVRHYLTAFHGAQYPQLLTMIGSLTEHCDPYRLTVLCLDRLALFYCQKYQINSLNFLTAQSLIKASPYRVQLRSVFDGATEMNGVPRSELLRPLLCELAVNFSESIQIIYVDPNVMFYAPFENVVGDVGTRQCFGMPMFRPAANGETGGDDQERYNPALIWFRKNDVCRDTIQAWVVQTLKGREGYQHFQQWRSLLGYRVMSFAPQVLVGPRQLPRISGSPAEMNGKVVTAFHFAGFKRTDSDLRFNTVVANGHRYVMAKQRVHPTTRRTIYEPYARLVRENTPEDHIVHEGQDWNRM